MGFKRDPKHGKILKCANEDCRKEDFLFEAIDNWAEHEGKYYCFSCSVKDLRIDWRNCFMTYRVEELKRRKNS